jgi:hypothetical protein
MGHPLFGAHEFKIATFFKIPYLKVATKGGREMTP